MGKEKYEPKIKMRITLPPRIDGEAFIDLVMDVIMGRYGKRYYGAISPVINWVHMSGGVYRVKADDNLRGKIDFNDDESVNVAEKESYTLVKGKLETYEVAGAAEKLTLVKGKMDRFSDVAVYVAPKDTQIARVIPRICVYEIDAEMLDPIIITTIDELTKVIAGSHYVFINAKNGKPISRGWWNPDHLQVVPKKNGALYYSESDAEDWRENYHELLNAV